MSEWVQFTSGPIERGKRVHGSVNGRFITVVSLPNSDELRCIDSICYHAGGPLGLGDIEEINGEACIKCAWHSYSVSLEDGGKFYEGLELDKNTKKLVPSGWKKKTMAQRVHKVEYRGASGVWVKLDNTEAKFDSDLYSFSQACGERVKAGDVVGAKKGRDGIMPQPNTTSGRAFAEQRWKHCRVVSNVRDGAREGFRLTVENPFDLEKEPLMLMDSSELFTNVEYLVIRIGTMQRYFTPLFLPTAKKHIVFSIRETNGMSSSLSRLRAGDTVDLRKRIVEQADPQSMDLSHLQQQQGGHMPQRFKQVLLLAAGSGVVPMYNVCCNVLNHTPSSMVTFVHFNRSEDTVLCRDLLKALDAQRVRHVFLYSTAATRKQDMAQTLKQILNEQQTKFQDEKMLISWCGPARFTESIAGELMQAGLTNAFMVPFLG